MNSRRSITVGVAAAVAILIVGSVEAQAKQRFSFGQSSVATDAPKKPGKQQAMWGAIQVPPDIDQSRELDYLCFFNVLKAGTDSTVPVKKVKANWETAAYILDHRTWSFEVLNFAAGTQKTNANGSSFIDLPIPASVSSAIFTDGFESGDTSAFIVTYVKLKKGKKLNRAELNCQLLEAPLSGVVAEDVK